MGRAATTCLVSFLASLAASSLAVSSVAQETVDMTLWSRVQGSGPLRAGNLLTAADMLNEELEAEGADYRVNLILLEQPAEGGFDGDLERMLRAFAINEGPDMFITAHELICSLADNGFALDLTDRLAADPEAFGTIYPSLWESTVCAGGGRYAVPQDTEARVFFYNKRLMREAGFDDEAVESLPERVLAGEVTLDGLLEIAQQVVASTDVDVGLLHQGNVGPDYFMIFNQYGNTFFDPETGRLLLERDKLADAYAWFRRGVEMGVIPSNMTSNDDNYSRDQFWGEQNAFMYLKGVWDIRSHAIPRGVPATEEAFFQDWGWAIAPPAEEGGEPGTLSHPIVYGVSATTEHPGIAVRIIGIASSPELNTEHAVTTSHLAIRPEQLAMPAYRDAWDLARATGFLEHTAFMPNHSGLPALNQILYEALQGVELGRISPEDAADFVIEQAQSRLPADALLIR